jgi:hypothetical protein
MERFELRLRFEPRVASQDPDRDHQQMGASNKADEDWGRGSWQGEAGFRHGEVGSKQGEAGFRHGGWILERGGDARAFNSHIKGLTERSRG